jgi:hypothetical protein
MKHTTKQINTSFFSLKMGISLLIWEVTLKFSEESIDFFQERLFKVKT